LLSGLLKKQSFVSEYSSGLEANSKKSSFDNKNPTPFKQQNRFGNKSSSGESTTRPDKKTPVKIVKKNMDIFD
jgi:hypothetical protein